MEESRISKNVKTRVVPNNNGYYEGYVYKEPMEEKESDDNIILNVKLEPGWNKVTMRCMTRKGCRSELKNWIKSHTIDELTIKMEKR